MTSLHQTPTESSAPPATAASSPATASPAAPAQSDFDALCTAMAEQGLFGKIRMGASLLFLGVATIEESKEKH